MRKNNENRESDIIRKIIAGDTALFRVLVNTYKDQSLSLAYSIIKNNDEAQDVLQDAFLRVFKNLHKFDFKSSFSTWLYRIVVNTCYSSLERSKKCKTISFENISYDTSADTSSSDLIRTNERKEIINKVLNTLKPNEALVLRLFYLGEQNINEISEITEMSASNIKVLLHRARKRFHTNLEKLVGSDKKNLYE